MRKRCDKTIFYTDRGWSTGMKFAKEYCIDNNLPYEERTVDVFALSKRVSFMSSDFCNAIIKDEPYDGFFME